MMSFIQLGIILLQDAAQPDGGLALYGNIIFLVLFLLIFYFFFIRPQTQRQRKEEEFRDSLSTGDKVLVFGGIHGQIKQIDKTSVLVTIDTNTKIRVQKAALQPFVSNEEAS